MVFNRLIFSEFHLCQRIFSRGLKLKPAWDITTGICVERLPVVTPPLNDIQKKYKELLYTIEIENSLKSDHEIRKDNDIIQAKQLKESIDVDYDTVSKITAQDFEDSSAEELGKFQFADIITEADKKGIKNTVDRCLQKHLVLVTSLKFGSDMKQVLPQGLWKEGETLRQTAERVLAQHCGPDLKVQFLSNAPCGFHKYKYPAEIDGKIGAKVFFYYANYRSGKVSEQVKHTWLTRSELEDALPIRYNKSVQQFLIEENI
ncbi:hypothetical protein ACJJTC_006760 [Scirpophaga incertulas]